MKYPVRATVNGKPCEVYVAAKTTLAEMLRDELDLLGVKQGCGEGECGACTVILNGLPVSSCLFLAVEASGAEITTIEGVADADGLHPLQQSFVEHGAVQCGFCTPGMVLSAKTLIDKVPDPSEFQIRSAISGNLCRCTGYQKIVDAVSRYREFVEEGSGGKGGGR
jgi:carbon-monoxide dehydrogenase small subunit